MSDVGRELVRLARSAFPRGIEVAGESIEDQVANTAELLRNPGTAVVFGAAFATERMVVQTDIVLRGPDGRLDVFEVKSGTKVKPRYVSDLALQVHTIEASGFAVRAAIVLHVNHRYQHVEGADPKPQQLFKNSDVTVRLRRAIPAVEEQVLTFQRQLADDSVLHLPTGTFCTQPFVCPHLASCAQAEPEFPLRELPDLTRKQEADMHLEGIADLEQIDPKRPGLTFRQRRMLAAVQQRTPIVEPFVRDELRQVDHPLHFLAVVDHLEALPRFEGQRPWRRLPYAFATITLHESGRIERTSFAHADRTDPRGDFVRQLAVPLEAGGMILCWGQELLASVRATLEDHPVDKHAIRTVLARPHLDMKRLFESGVFHPGMHGKECLEDVVEVLLGDRSSRELPIRCDEGVFSALQKAWTPRVRSATKEKIAGDLRAHAEWQAQALHDLYLRYAEVAQRAAPAAERPARPRKQLPPT